MQPSQQRVHRPPLNQGITLIEILLFCIISALLISIFLSIYRLDWHKSTDDNPSTPAMLTIYNAMKFYKLDNGMYPTTDQGLRALIIKPTIEPIPQHWRKYLKAIPRDAQGRVYHYHNPGKHHEIDISFDE